MSLSQAASRKQQVTQSSNSIKAISAADAAIGQKALDVVVLDIGQVTDFTNYFIIASATSDRHARGIADKVEEHLRVTYNEKPLSCSGYEKGEWIVLDYADFVVHVFHEPTRQYYALDHLWDAAPVVKLPEELETVARKLRTGMLRP